jgi:hypothetical protein
MVYNFGIILFGNCFGYFSKNGRFFPNYLATVGTARQIKLERLSLESFFPASLIFVLFEIIIFVSWTVL